jgi:glutathione synthase/RimK-type ligase-like ATP-grasp enzyme
MTPRVALVTCAAFPGLYEDDLLLVPALAELAWNFDKRYLEELASAGVSVVPTVCLARGEKPDLAALARARGWKEIVIKPSISGGAYRTHRLRVEDAGAHAADVESIVCDRGLLMQPFLPEITEGEPSLMFFDGVFSHAKTGSFR